MDIHYENNSQFSKMIKNPKKFTLPKYGPSTTDPTYYEPQGTRIANMRKSAQSLESLYDFTGSLDTKGKTKEQIFAEAEKRGMSELSSSVVDVRFSKHGLTREEISQVTMEKSLEADSMIKNKKSEKEEDSKQNKKELESAKAIAKEIANIPQNKASEGSGEA